MTIFVTSLSRHKAPFYSAFHYRGARIRTGDLLLPKQARYQAAPRPAWLAECIHRRQATRRPCRATADPGRRIASDLAMAEIQAFRALHYDRHRTGGLQDVVAPPYDVIDDQQRRELEARSPYNVVRIDLPQGGEDRYERAAETLEQWRAEGIVVQDEEPALWTLAQDYVGPDGERRTREGVFARVRVEDYGPGRIRPHERTHPGPREDRLRLTRATRANLSPIFSLFSDPDNAAWTALAPSTEKAPWGETRDADGTVNRLWRVSDPDVIKRVQEAASGAELLIA